MLRGGYPLEIEYSLKACYINEKNRLVTCHVRRQVFCFFAVDILIYFEIYKAARTSNRENTISERAGKSSIKNKVRSKAVKL